MFYNLAKNFVTLGDIAPKKIAWLFQNSCFLPIIQFGSEKKINSIPGWPSNCQKTPFLAHFGTIATSSAVELIWNSSC